MKIEVNYIAFCVGGIVLLPWSAVNAGVVKFSYDVEVTPSQNGVALSYNFDDGQSVLAQESDPSYDGTWDGTTIPSSANERVDVGVSEADAVTALLDGDTTTLAAIETGAQDASEPLFILENLVSDPSVQMLDFSKASDGGNGSIDQDVTASVPEPGMIEFALLGALGPFGSRRKRSRTCNGVCRS